METIQTVLFKFLPREIIKYYIEGSSAARQWTKALTHSSVNVKDNYEKLETFGDSSLGLAFNIYLMEIRNIKDHGIVNNLNTYYMSEQYQPKMAKKLGLANIAIISPTVPLKDKILEDILEAFFGAFTLIGRKLWQKNPGKFKYPTHYIIDFFRWYFLNVDNLDIEKNGMGPIKSFFQNMYDHFSQLTPQKIRGPKYDQYRKKMIFDSDFLTGVKNYSNRAETEVRKIMTSSGHDENYYYTRVVEILEKYGYDKKWFDEEKLRVGFGKAINDIAKASGNGLTRFILVRNNKGSYDLLAQGVDKEKNSFSRLLRSFGPYESFDTLKDEATKIILDLYAS